MRDLTVVINNCISDLNAIGIYPNKIEKIEINTRAKSRWGQCKYNTDCFGDRHYSININALLLDERTPMNSLLDTCYHELLHAVDGCMNHGSKWESLADLVSDCYSVNISRCSSADEKLGEEMKVVKTETNPKKIYKAKCACCGKIITQKGYRMPKWYKHCNDTKYDGSHIYYHSVCGKYKGKIIPLGIEIEG